MPRQRGRADSLATERRRCLPSDRHALRRSGPWSASLLFCGKCLLNKCEIKSRAPKRLSASCVHADMLNDVVGLPLSRPASYSSLGRRLATFTLPMTAFAGCPACGWEPSPLPPTTPRPARSRAQVQRSRSTSLVLCACVMREARYERCTKRPKGLGNVVGGELCPAKKQRTMPSSKAHPCSKGCDSRALDCGARGSADLGTAEGTRSASPEKGTEVRLEQQV